MRTRTGRRKTILAVLIGAAIWGSVATATAVPQPGLAGAQAGVRITSAPHTESMAGRALLPVLAGAGISGAGYQSSATSRELGTTVSAKAAGRYTFVDANNVNARSGPGVGYGIVARHLGYGQGFSVTCWMPGQRPSGAYPIWYRGVLWGGPAGWIREDYLNVDWTGSYRRCWN